MRVAVDAMGGDRAPGEVVAGALEASASEQVDRILLVGDEEVLRPYLTEGNSEGIEVVHATQVVGMNEPPASSVRRKKDSSIVRCLGLLRDGRADAVVTAGNTGALVAGASMVLKMIKGVRRPGIAVDLPTPSGSCLVIDAGANLKAKPLHLYHYGLMGSLFVQRIRDEERPSIGILSVGSESIKGNELVKRTREVFESSDVDFVGNVEGHDIFLGRASVVVCEGFVGNVLLKVSEGLAAATAVFLRQILEGELTEAGLERDAFERVLSRFERWTDYSEYGGAPLLGVQGTCFVCHGKSRAKAIANAIREAARTAREGVIEAIAGEIAGRTA